MELQQRVQKHQDMTLAGIMKVLDKAQMFRDCGVTCFEELVAVAQDHERWKDMSERFQWTERGKEAVRRGIAKARGIKWTPLAGQFSKPPDTIKLGLLGSLWGLAIHENPAGDHHAASDNFNSNKNPSQMIVASNQGRIFVYENCMSGEPARTLYIGNLINNIALTRDGGRLIVGFHNCEYVSTFDTTSWRITETYRLPYTLKFNHHICVHPNDRDFLFVGDKQGPGAPLDTLTFVGSLDDKGVDAFLRAVDSMREFPTFAAVFHPAGKMFVAGNCEGELGIWEYRREKSVLKATHTLGQGKSAPAATVFTKDGKYLITGSMDKTIKIWDFLAGTMSGIRKMWEFDDGKHLQERPGMFCMRTLANHDSDVCSIAISPDMAIMASVDGMGTLIIWAFDTGEIIADDELPQPYTAMASRMAFTADSQKLVVGGLCDRIRVFDRIDKEGLEKEAAEATAARLARVKSVSVSTGKKRKVELEDVML
jgi:WD40 repeat protein